MPNFPFGIEGMFTYTEPASKGSLRLLFHPPSTNCRISFLNPAPFGQWSFMGQRGLVFAQEICYPALPGFDFLGTCLRTGEFFHRHGTKPVLHGTYVFSRIIQGLGMSSSYLLFFHDIPFPLPESKILFSIWTL
jgi:hypothetical protein